MHFDWNYNIELVVMTLRDLNFDDLALQATVISSMQSPHHVK